jgi:hypothetical protein
VKAKARSLILCNPLSHPVDRLDNTPYTVTKSSQDVRDLVFVADKLKDQFLLFESFDIMLASLERLPKEVFWMILERVRLIFSP